MGARGRAGRALATDGLLKECGAGQLTLHAPTLRGRVHKVGAAGAGAGGGEGEDRSDSAGVAAGASFRPKR